MSAVAESTAAFSAAASRELGEGTNDTPAIAALRSEAVALSSKKAWPDSRKERPWKYHNIATLDLGRYTPGMSASNGAAAGVRSCPVTGEHAAAIVLENSDVIFSEASPDGLDLIAFSALIDGRLQKLVDERLGSAVAAGTSKLTALHYAFLAGGVLVATAPNSEFKEPVRIVRNYSGGGQFAAPHTLIVTGANSRVHVVEECRSDEGDIVVMPAVEVLPGPGSVVRHTVVHRWGTNTKVYTEQRMVSERDSEFVSLQIVAGGGVVKGHLESSLVARGSSSELYGVTLGTGNQHADFFTTQDHVGPDTRSDLLFKSALRGHARSVYYGMTRVGLGARNADANQENRNLLLSDTARADSDPVLEILTSDVIRVSHGATAGPVDEEQLYYLQTRGIPYEAAEALLVRAFAGQVLDRVADEALRDELSAVLDARWDSPE
ncbi:MAG: SufD family Fe-S cluster assembly protein [Dehalococcoidia bacterium]|nr:SufD family Fe-S cluster assembly protein [Dehalococcoidia bacterium]MCB9484885.1 SufD family Fe-S cluster assembly protein [Thermoflexaceae bacterium]